MTTTRHFRIRWQCLRPVRAPRLHKDTPISDRGTIQMFHESRLPRDISSHGCTMLHGICNVLVLHARLLFSCPRGIGKADARTNKFPRLSRLSETSVAEFSLRPSCRFVYAVAATLQCRYRLLVSSETVESMEDRLSLLILHFE
ncbi:Protein of unknown function [Pyronema omphalodes CBS 100304]|uniref:Uncharacterized protein n=1 Tax=Pyronema omphalodes (strain CBS 100304) TaxID=1076935 RepID=U4L494_PYROM|nr:Protein of unknown function [Pyronema omphalodes CBS 100304]